MNKLRGLLLIVSTFTLAACGGGSGGSSSSGSGNTVLRGDGNTVFYDNSIVPSEFLNASGEVADPQAYCTHVWETTFDRVMDGLVKTYRETTGNMVTTTSTEILGKTDDSYTQRLTRDSGFGEPTVVTLTTQRGEYIQTCVEGFTTNDQDNGGLEDFAMRIDLLAQRSETVTVPAGTFATEYIEATSSVSTSGPDGQTFNQDMHMRIWSGTQGLAEGVLIRSVSEITTDFGQVDPELAPFVMGGPSTYTMELIELYVR